MLRDLSFPLIVAHRGLSAAYPENTLAAFDAAIDAGAAMLEFDVALSLDRKPVVIHDDTVDRVTDGQGPVTGHTLAALKRLDAGSWFSPEFRGERVPSLGEVLERVGRRSCLNIEIKASAYEIHQPDDAVEQQVVSLVRRYGLSDGVVISSFEHRLLERIHRMERPPAVAVLTETPLSDAILRLLERLNAFSWNAPADVLDPEQVARVHAQGHRVLAFTVNDPDRFRRLMDMGVDGVFSDDPGRLAIR